MDSPAASDVDSILSKSNVMTSAPSSPPGEASPKLEDIELVDDSLLQEEEQAREDNLKAEAERRKAALAQKRKRKKKAETEVWTVGKAKQGIFCFVL